MILFCATKQLQYVCQWKKFSTLNHLLKVAFCLRGLLLHLTLLRYTWDPLTLRIKLIKSSNVIR